MTSSPHRLVAALACRNTGTRLYAKPLQRLGTKTILEHMIDQLRTLESSRAFRELGLNDLAIVLGVSEGVDNMLYPEMAKAKGIGYIIGSEEDVQFRLLQCAHLAKADIILRLTTESPFTAWEYFPAAYRVLADEQMDLATVRHLPDGCSFELIRTEALKRAHDEGNEKTRNELATKYLFNHPNEFRLKSLDPMPEHDRFQYRLTVDHPDDLMVCRKIFDSLSKSGEFPAFDSVIKYVDQHPELMQQLAWIDGSYGRHV